MMTAVKVCYLDASALVKLVADDRDEEPGREAVREYYHSNANMKATPYCVAETLSVFKRKHLTNKISRKEYKNCIKTFLHKIIGANLSIEEPEFPEYKEFGSRKLPILKLLSKAEEFLDVNANLDFIDCIQLADLMHGRYSRLQSLFLITADKNLAKAARSKGISVWECTSEPPPS